MCTFYISHWAKANNRWVAPKSIVIRIDMSMRYIYAVHIFLSFFLFLLLQIHRECCAVYRKDLMSFIFDQPFNSSS